MLKDIVGARVFYNNISSNIENKKGEVLWYCFESNLYRKSLDNKNNVNDLNQYIDENYKKDALYHIGFILENQEIVKGVYYYKDKDEIIFLKVSGNSKEKEVISFVDYIVENRGPFIIDNKFYDNFILDIISRIVYVYYDSKQQINFLEELIFSNSSLEMPSGFDVAILYSEHESLSFIIGTGVNIDLGQQLSKSTNSLPKSLSSGNWDDLVDLINKGIVSCFPNSTLTKDELKEFNDGMSNINYFSPELLKKLDYKKYKDIIIDFLYGDINEFVIADCLLRAYLNPDIKNTYLYKIAQYMSKNSNSKLLSFNYDDFFDRIYKYNLGSECNNTVNPHGFIKDYRIKEISKRSTDIVLSSFEYMNGYSLSNSRARRLTREHLDRANIIIGNSLADYEEQKVFRLKYLKNRFFRSFLIAKELKNKELNFMKFLYFRSIGVIYCPVKDYSEISDFLDQINK